MTTTKIQVGFAMKRLLVSNNKGGVGKTTMTTHLADYFAVKKGMSVLVIDFDGQCNTTQIWVGADKKGEFYIPKFHPDYSDEIDWEGETNSNPRSSIADLYLGLGITPYPTHLQKVEDGMIAPPHNPLNGEVDVACGNGQLMFEMKARFNPLVMSKDMSDIKGLPTTSEEAITNLDRFLTENGVDDVYDVVIIDSSPTDSVLFRAAINAASHVLCPYDPDPMALKGVPAIMSHVTNVNIHRAEHRPSVKFLGLLPNKVQKRHSNKAAVIEQATREFKDNHFPEDYYIGLYTAISDRTAQGVGVPGSIFDLPASTPARQQMEKVFGYIAEKMGL